MKRWWWKEKQAEDLRSCELRQVFEWLCLLVFFMSLVHISTVLSILPSFSVTYTYMRKILVQYNYFNINAIVLITFLNSFTLTSKCVPFHNVFGANPNKDIFALQLVLIPSGACLVLISIFQTRLKPSFLRLSFSIWYPFIHKCTFNHRKDYAILPDSNFRQLEIFTCSKCVWRNNPITFRYI